MGEEQKYYFYLADVAALIKLPWSRPLGESIWDLTTRLIASAGLLTEANESSLMMTAVPVLALSGGKGLVTFDPEWEQDSSATIRSACKTSGVRMKLPAASCGVSQNSISKTSRKQRRTP